MTDSYRPVIRDNQILAGGIRVARVDDEGRVIFEDRYQRRCAARGSQDVPIDLVELLDILADHYRT